MLAVWWQVVLNYNVETQDMSHIYEACFHSVESQNGDRLIWALSYPSQPSEAPKDRYSLDLLC